MRPIPTSLLAKLNKYMQTQAENADPKMSILIRRALSGVTNQDLFRVLTIREEPDAEQQTLEMLGIALERSDPEKPPFKAWNIYIQDGICKVATMNLPAKARKPWTDVLTIGDNVLECDITFDGRWVRDRVGRWNLITIGPPWIFWTTTTGQLFARYWDLEDPILLASGVDGKIAALRGWKNAQVYNHDHGIVCAYIKQGLLYYRNFCQQPDGQSIVWEQERTPAGIPSPVQDIGLMRTNDYRMGFLVESNGDIWLATTPRNWAGIGVPSDTFSSEMAPVVSQIQFDVLHIKTYAYAAPSETINNPPSVSHCRFSMGTDAQMNTSVDVVDGLRVNDHTFYIELSHDAVVWNDDYFKMFGLTLAYQIDYVETIGKRLYVHTVEPTYEFGFSVTLTANYLEGRITTHCYNYVAPQLVQIKGAMPEIHETYNIAPKFQTINFTLLSITTDRYVDTIPTETYSATPVVTNIQFTLIRVNTDPV